MFLSEIKLSLDSSYERDFIDVVKELALFLFNLITTTGVFSKHHLTSKPVLGSEHKYSCSCLESSDQTA